MSTDDAEKSVNQALMDAVVRTMQTLDEHVNRYVAQRLAESNLTNDLELHLSRRERQVLPLILEGLLNKEIGVRLGISERTVKFHVSSILRKSGATSRLALLREHKVGPNLQIPANS